MDSSNIDRHIIGIDIDDAVEGQYIICSYCNTLSDHSWGFQIDYVSRPMLWCPGCEARCFLDLPLLDKGYFEDKSVVSFMENNIEIPKEQIREMEDNITIDIGYGGDETFDDMLNKCKFYYVKCLYIESIINDETSNLVITEELPYQKKFEFMEKLKRNRSNMSIGFDGEKNKYNQDIHKDIDYNKNLLSEYKLKFYDYCDLDFDDIEQFDKGLYLPCNSYNASNPDIDYPTHYSLDHDGIYIYCKCINVLDNKITIEQYSGD